MTQEEGDTAPNTHGTESHGVVAHQGHGGGLVAGSLLSFMLW